MNEITSSTCIFPLRVLFLCTHNAARSILAEALLNHLGPGRFQAYSAGSHPRPGGQPNPLGLQVLREVGIDTTGLSSKSWSVFAQPDAPQIDLVITVCDNAAAEACPVWPGHPATAHWGYADPSAVGGSTQHQLDAFRLTLSQIRQRLQQLAHAPDELLSPKTLQATARRLGAS